MKLTVIAPRVVAVLTFAASSGFLFAGAIPIANQQGGGFYSIQLRGLSVDAGGENAAVTIYDNTDDQSAFGSIEITDSDTSSVVFNQNYDNTCFCFSVGSLTDVASFELAPGNYIVTETAHEYSQADVIFGNTVEAAAGYFNSAPDPTFTTDFTVVASAPEPASIALVISGLGLLIFKRRKTLHRE